MICAWEVATQSLLYQARRKKEMTKKSDEASFTKDVSSTAKNTDTQLIFLEGVLYSSLCGFMLSYHVHEKAIMTCILPMTAIACTTSSSSGHTIIRHRFFRLCVYGHFGLLPLLYQSTEGALKLGLYFVYLIWLMYEWEDLMTLKYKMNLLAVWSTSITLIYTEVLHPFLCKVNFKFSRWEFLPLLMTSTVCALGLTHGWFESAWKLRQDLHTMIMDE
jgi:alpha-1,3-glucosyltransferase